MAVAANVRATEVVIETSGSDNTATDVRATEVGVEVSGASLAAGHVRATEVALEVSHPAHGEVRVTELALEVSIIEGCTCDAPAELSVTGKARSAILIWSPSAAGITVRIYRSDADHAETLIAMGIDGTLGTYTDAGLTVDVTYTYRIKFQCMCGPSDFSGPVTMRSTCCDGVFTAAAAPSTTFTQETFPTATFTPESQVASTFTQETAPVSTLARVADPTGSFTPEGCPD